MDKGKLNLFKSNKWIIAFVIVGIALLTAAVILIILNFDSVKAIFSGESGSGSDNNSVNGTIPDMNIGETVGGNEIFYENDENDIFALINVRESYVRELRVVSSYNMIQTTEAVKLTKAGDKYKAESSSKDLIYSDGKLYIKSNLYSLTTEAEVTDIYTELGITPLDKVIEIASLDGAMVSLSNDGKLISVYATDPNTNGRSEYEISIENGIVTREIHYINGQAVRSVFTDSVDIMIGSEITDSLFEIPTQE